MVRKILVKMSAGEREFNSADEVRAAFLAGKICGGDLLQLPGTTHWTYVAEIAEIAPLFASAPSVGVEKAANMVFVPGKNSYQAGPFTLSELKARISRGEFAPASWVSLEGNTNWQQIRAVAQLSGMLPPLPNGAISASEKLDLAIDANMGEHSVKLDLKEAMELDAAPSPPSMPPPAAPPSMITDDGIEREDPTLAISTLGLNAAPPTPPTPVPPVAPAPTPASMSGDFDGITVEIPKDPIWLIKQGTSENVAGPFRFFEVVDFLKKGKLSKSDKISKAGTNRFQKISQQYEFNVSYSVENVVQGGVETKKILIRRRHPRVSYMADVQVVRQGKVLAGQCVNISAGGVMVEVPKVELEIGEKLQIKILPALIPRQISCAVTLTGKVSKIPPGYALQFDTLSKEDKEAIEYFVVEALKREKVGKQTEV